MYLHIGRETMLRHQDIIGVFDIETTSVSKVTRDFLSEAEKAGRVVNVTDELPKSFIVCRGAKKGKGSEKSPGRVYISQISSTTLLKRLHFLKEVSLPED